MVPTDKTVYHKIKELFKAFSTQTQGSLGLPDNEAHFQYTIEKALHQFFTPLLPEGYYMAVYFGEVEGPEEVELTLTVCHEATAKFGLFDPAVVSISVDVWQTSTGFYMFQPDRLVETYSEVLDGYISSYDDLYTLLDTLASNPS